MAEIESGQGNTSVVRAGAGSSGAGASRAPVVSHIRLRRSGTVDAAGQIALSVGIVPASCEWFIERISIKCSSNLQTVFDMYEDMEDDLYRLEHSPIGNDNIADYAAPIWLPSYANLLVVWSEVEALNVDGGASIAQITAQIKVVN